ncbi:hypothetical protein I656_03189 [Geobacillus sp. WSUCF1]|nr:hypothetical protein I656_03189 [Geobacillus sp. WSUCF1]
MIFFSFKENNGFLRPVFLVNFRFHRKTGRLQGDCSCQKRNGAKQARSWPPC